MTKVWIVEGLGDDNVKPYKLKATEKVGDLKRQFASKLGVSEDEIEVSTDTRRLTNESAVLAKVIEEGETLHILPRAKAGQ